jgi:acetyl-CoA carboxylase biotin carboxylase subunit
VFTRILVANRGEIAVRVLRTCRVMGIETVAVYSDADAHALHVSLADQAVRIGGAAPAESYLSQGAILDAARATGAQAVHPGYGFLSENDAFAAACAGAGLTFIGPSPDAMARLGSKTAARRLAEAAGVPVVPGAIPADQSDAAISAAALQVGFPVLLKPSEGGGGIGMKAVQAAADLPAAIAQARREAEAAFGDGTLYVERLVARPRHIEFQVLGDLQGTVVHLFERECSIQRRHQKVLEETPSTAVTPGLRSRMGAAAVALAKAAGYSNAGTVEFLVDGHGDTAHFYFLEMNARLQVEHPITEAVTGVDLVRAQIEVAAGRPVPWTQEQLSQRGHAIEVRVCAEDPRQGFLPQAGTLALYREPSMPGIRIDAGVTEGSTVSVHYDSLLAKLVAWGETRDAARQRARQALAQYPILGIRTNAPLLLRLLEHERFVAGDLDTHFLQTEAAALMPADGPPSADARAVAARARLSGTTATATTAGPAGTADPDPWVSLGGRRV